MSFYKYGAASLLPLPTPPKTPSVEQPRSWSPWERSGMIDRMQVDLTRPIEHSEIGKGLTPPIEPSRPWSPWDSLIRFDEKCLTPVTSDPSPMEVCRQMFLAPINNEDSPPITPRRSPVNNERPPSRGPGKKSPSFSPTTLDSIVEDLNEPTPEKRSHVQSRSPVKSPRIPVRRTLGLETIEE